MIVDRCVVVWRRAWQLHMLTPLFGRVLALALAITFAVDVWSAAAAAYSCCESRHAILFVGWMAIGWRLAAVCLCALPRAYFGTEPDEFCIVDGPDACHEA